jgi:phosphoglycerate dehydrogenase-like enzyme
MGIVGYGDIGKSCAHLAKAFGMNIIALRKRPELSVNDELVDQV